jgi:TldD protein
MANELVQPDRFFLDRFGLNERAFERTLGIALERKADYADLYFEFRSAEALTLEDSIVNRTAKRITQGVGVRVCAEDRTGYAYSDEVTVDRMRLAAETARVIADQSHKPGAVQVGKRTAGHDLYAIQTSPNTNSDSREGAAVGTN